MAGKFFKFPVIFFCLSAYKLPRNKSGTLGYRESGFISGMEMVKCGKNAKTSHIFTGVAAFFFTDRGICAGRRIYESR